MDIIMIYEQKIDCHECGKEVKIDRLFLSEDHYLYVMSKCSACGEEGENWVNIDDEVMKCKIKAGGPIVWEEVKTIQ